MTTYHALLQRLIFTPLPELASLRGAVLFSGALDVAAGAVTPLSGGWPAGAGNTSETALSFTLPAAAGVFGLRVWGDSAAPGAFNDLLISFDPVSFTANVSWAAKPSSPSSYYMVGVDMPGDDLSVTNVNYTDPHLCQLACNQTAGCTGFTYVVRPPLKGACCLKSGYPAQDANPTCTSGVKPGGPGPGPARAASTPIPLLAGDVAVDVRVYIDNTFVEVFIMEGRLALTLLLKDNPVADVALGLFANGTAVHVGSADVWAMKPIWTSPSAVLALRSM